MDADLTSAVGDLLAAGVTALGSCRAEIGDALGVPYLLSESRSISGQPSRIPTATTT